MKAQKVAKGVLGAVLTGAVLYWGGVNAILASPLGPKILNQKPELVQFRYQRAYTLMPLELEIDGLELSLQDRLVQISVTAEHASGEIRLWKLAQQRLEAAHVVATGVTMHIRPRMDLQNAHDLGELPPINGFATPVRDILPIDVDANQVRFIVLALQDVTVHHFRELWVDRIRYEGDAEVSGGLLFEPFKLLRLDDVHFVDAQSKVTIGPSPAAHFDTLDARITLGNFALNSIDLKQLSTLDADVLISAEAEPRFLNDYLSNAPGLSTVRASGSPGHL